MSEDNIDDVLARCDKDVERIQQLEQEIKHKNNTLDSAESHVSELMLTIQSLQAKNKKLVETILAMLGAIDHEQPDKARVWGRALLNELGE